MSVRNVRVYAVSRKTSSARNVCRREFKLKFHGRSFFVSSTQHPRDILSAAPDTRDILARMLRGCRACRACRATSPFTLPCACLIGRPADCCCIMLPVCPCVVSFSIVHEHDTHDLLRTSRQYQHPRRILVRHVRHARHVSEDATSKLLPWNLSFTTEARTLRSRPSDHES